MSKEAKDEWPEVARVCTTVLGRDMTPDAQLLPHAPSLSVTIRATRFILKTRRCSLKVLERWVGRWIWALLTRRCLLSVLSAVFSFVRSAPNVSKPRNLPWRVRDELQALLDLVPCLVVDMRTPASSMMMATDASTDGEGVT